MIDFRLNCGYADFTVTHLTVGFDSSFSFGTKALCQSWYMAFFMPFAFMVGGVMGSRKGLAARNPLCQPVISSIARMFDSFGRWFKYPVSEHLS